MRTDPQPQFNHGAPEACVTVPMSAGCRPARSPRPRERTWSFLIGSLTAAGAVAVGTLGLAAPADADAGGPWNVVVYSPDNGIFGGQNQAYNFKGALDATMANCKNAGGDQCRVAASAHNGCVAIAAMTPALTPTGHGALGRLEAVRPSPTQREPPSPRTALARYWCRVAQPVGRVWGVSRSPDPGLCYRLPARCAQPGKAIGVVALGTPQSG
jgi:hypothetical protein